MRRALRTLAARAWALLHRDRLDREFDEELTTHLELLIDEGRRAGLSDEAARREALRKLGQPNSIRERHRDQRGSRALDVLTQDAGYALRMLRKSPAFTAIATLSLALGIGANTALFSLVDSLLLRSLPVRDPDRLVQLRYGAGPAGFKKISPFFSQTQFDYFREHNEAFSELVGFASLDRPLVTIDGATEADPHVDQISNNFFRDLGVTPIAGRAPETSDDAVAILSYRFWQDRFGGRAEVLGRTITIDRQPFVIIGVAPRRFFGVALESDAAIWIANRAPMAQQVIARIKPDVSATQAQAGVQVMLNQLAQEQGERADRVGQAELVPAGKGLSQLRSQYERPLLALTALVVVLLLITCTNIGNLFMVRHAARKRELAVRVALGAHRSRLVLQYLVESVILAAIGGTLGWVFARWGVAILLSMLPLPFVPSALIFNGDWRVVAFAVATSLLSALLFGLMPAWRAGEINLGMLRANEGGGAPRAKRLSGVLIACQVGLSVLLLVGAGLFVQTLRNLSSVDLGFNPDGLLQILMDTRAGGYRQGQVGGVYNQLLTRLTGIPGVRSVTAVRNPLMRGLMSRAHYDIPGVELAPDESWDAAQVSPSFFDTMGIALVSGRTFTDTDATRDQFPVIVSESFVKRYLPGKDPIGVRLGQQQRTEIIGVARDARLSGVRVPSGVFMYNLLEKEPDRINALEVRFSGDPAAVVPAIREEIRQVHPRLLLSVTTMRRHIDDSIAKERMVAATSTFFSVLGLLLASIGVFGVASYAVTRRTNELGIRLALGASRGSVILESLRGTLVMFLVGLAGGIVAAVAAVRMTSALISDLLFGLRATDAANVVAAVALLILVTVLACLLPARRATRIDPLAAIRCE